VHLVHGVTFPQVNDHGNEFSVDGARMHPNRLGTALWRSRSMSSMLSARRLSSPPGRRPSAARPASSQGSWPLMQLHRPWSKSTFGFKVPSRQPFRQRDPGLDVPPAVRILALATCVLVRPWCMLSENYSARMSSCGFCASCVPSRRNARGGGLRGVSFCLHIICVCHGKCCLADRRARNTASKRPSFCGRCQPFCAVAAGQLDISWETDSAGEGSRRACCRRGYATA
jgi:hypothetical protein